MRGTERYRRPLRSSFRPTELLRTTTSSTPGLEVSLPRRPRATGCVIGYECQKPQACHRAGCSGELCTDQPGLASPCLWADWYQCYDLAVCGIKGSGCGWNETPAFLTCMAKFKP